MNDRNDNQHNGPDDELGELLRSEVPAPGADYWSQIDARLEQAEAELGRGGESGREADSDELQTNQNVIRLTFTDKHDTTPNRSRLPLYGAVACGLLIVTGGLVLINRSTSPAPVAGTIPSTIDVPTTVTTPDVDITAGLTYEDVPAQVWTVVGDGPLDITTGPSIGLALSTVQVGDQLGGVGTVAVDESGARWVNVWATDPSIGVIGMVPADRLAPAEFPTRQCYSSTEPAETVLYLDFAAPEGEPIGAYVFAEDNPSENGADVRLVALAPQPDEAGDALDVLVQVDDTWELENWAQTSFGVVGPTFAWEPVDCTEVGDALALIEGFRNDIPLP